VGRLLVANVLRLIIALSVGLAIVFALLTMVGLALAAFSLVEIRHQGDIAVMAVCVLAVLLAGARLAYLTLGRIVELGPADERGAR